jgi:hypothetical protein
MKRVHTSRTRPDIDAAVRGGDWSLAMDGEGVPGHATLKQALYWRQIYTEILGMEEKVLKRIRQLMAKQSDAARREVELTNVPVVIAQAERFRQRLGYWEARLHKLNGAASSKRRRRVPPQPRAAPRSLRSTQTATGINLKEVFMKDQVRGKAEEIEGKVTGNRGTETKGKARQALGDVKRAIRDVKQDGR